ncbi:20148_t:CDS:2, partial [Gigaspora margarita]
RISIILKYDNLDELACAQVWHTFLDCEDGKDESQAIATKSDSDAVITTSHLEKILDISIKNL